MPRWWLPLAASAGSHRQACGLQRPSFAACAAALSTSSSVAEQRDPSIKQSPYRLTSAAAYEPHPEKKATGGEDASFVGADGLSVGVADGVGGWAEENIDAGVYARLLMSQAQSALQQAEPLPAIPGRPEEPQTEPLRVLVQAHARTRVPGSSTALIVCLRDTTLHACNLGDSCFMVLRDNKVLFKSPQQQHQFNFPFQCGAYRGGDSPLVSQLFSVQVQPGDVLILGTDGLWDNLFDGEIAQLVCAELEKGGGPAAAAATCVRTAHVRGADPRAHTPFEQEAHKARIRFYGGKQDDVTCVVSVVERAPAAGGGTVLGG